MTEPFENVNKPRQPVKSYRCPCCGYKTLCERGGYEICQVCFWEDDGQDDHDTDEARGGPNGSLSLTQARLNYKGCGAYDPKFQRNVKSALPEEF